MLLLTTTGLTVFTELLTSLSNCCLLVFLPIVLVMFPFTLNPEGVYAWIGINFVLGRFEHADDGECVEKTFLKRSLMFVWVF